MPVTMMTREPDQATSTVDYHGETIHLKTSFVGATLSIHERNGYHDSDFFATVWNEETQSIETIEYGTTRGWTYCNNARPDATPEVIEKAKNWCYQQALADWDTYNEKQKWALRPGSRVEVIAGRKVKKGEIGTVVSIEPDEYSAFKSSNYWFPGTRYSNYKIFMKLDSGAYVRTYSKNLKVLEPQYLPIEEREASAQSFAAARVASNFRSESSFFGNFGRYQKLIFAGSNCFSPPEDPE